MKLKSKHPPPAADRRLRCDPADNARFEPLQVSSDDVVRALRSFPLGSAGGPDGLSPQHIADLVAGATADSLQQALVDWVNLLLAGSFDKDVNTIIYRGSLIALSKKDGGIRPITVGYTLRRLAAKCAIQRGNACWPISSICLSCSVLSCGLLLCKEEMRFLSQHHGHRVN